MIPFRNVSELVFDVDRQKAISRKVEETLSLKRDELIDQVEKLQFPSQLRQTDTFSKHKFAELLWNKYKEEGDENNYELAFRNLLLFKKFSDENSLRTGLNESSLNELLIQSLSPLRAELYQKVSQEYADPIPKRYSFTSKKSESSFLSSHSLLAKEVIHPEHTNFTVTKVPGDGNCLFTSLAMGMNPGLSVTEVKTEVKELRHRIEKLLLEKREKVVESVGLSIEQVVLMEVSDFEEYAASMGKYEQGLLAGEIEIWLLAQDKDLCVNVFVKGDEGEFVHMVSYGQGENVVDLLWTQGFTEKLNHYDLLRRNSP